MTSAANAATSATASAGSATTASGHASATLAYRNEAEGFKNTAVSSASSATTSATNAAADRVQTGLDRTAAANSATAAASSEAAAATYLTQTQAARDATLAALDNFDDKYLGEYELDPTLDNDGNALVSGALYFNPNSGSQGTMKVYNGTMWVAAYADLSGALVAAANLSDLTNIPAARANLGLGTAATTAASAYATAAQGAKADTALQPAAIGTTVQGYSSALQGTTASFTSAEKAKLAYISVTANVNLDTVVSTLAGKANTVHTHAIADITGLQTQLDTLASGVSGAAAGEHSHDIADVTGLQTALDGKVGTSDARLTDSREWSSATVDQAEAEAGTATTRRAWTSQRVRQAIASWWNSSASKTKLDGIETGATADQTPAEILTAIKTVDGTGSGLDADTLDGQEASAFAAASHTHTIANVTGLQTALDAKLALTGGTVTGPITLTNAASAIIVNGVNNDVTLLRVNSSTANQYGFSLKYMGTRNDNDNSLSIFTDNLTGPAVEAWKMLQNGQIVMTSRPMVNTNVMIDAGNYTDYTVTKAGVGATGTWGISITGSAATVTNGVVTTGAYADPAWITSLNYTKLTGTVPTWNQSTTGNAATATKLATARTLSLTGDVTGSVSFDGSANASITATVADDSHNHIISNVDGLQTALDAKVAISSIVDSLTSTVTNVPLSAAQGKVLKDSIDAISALLSSDNLSLDSLQEVVNYIIANRNTLESLGIANISGLQAALDAKVSLATAGQTIAGQLTLSSDTFAGQLRILRTGGDFYSVIQYSNSVSGELGKAGFNETGDFVIRHRANAADDWKVVNGSLTVGTIPGARVSGAISGNAATATKLATARTLSLTGDVTGSVSFDGSANASITATVADDSHNHIIANVDGLQIALDGKAASSHTHAIADVTGLQTALDGKASLTGAGVSGTWAISITGNAATASAVAWANITSKPTTLTGYSVTALQVAPSTVKATANTFDATGIAYCDVALFGQVDGALFANAYSAAYQHQIFGDYRSGQAAVRGKNNGVWGAWRTLIDSSNVGSFAMPLAGGAFTGGVQAAADKYFTDGFYGFDMRNSDIVGINSLYFQDLAETQEGLHFYRGAGTWDTLRAANGVLYFARNRATAGTEAGDVVLHSANYTDYTVTKTGGGASGSWGISITGNAATVTNGVVTTGSYANPAWITSLDYGKLTGTVPTWNQNTTGNAATATAFQTARTINGVSFNGSANITVTANTPNAVTFNNSGTGVASGSTFNGGAAVTVSHNSVGAPSTTGAGASGTWAISVTGNAATVTNGVVTTGSYADPSWITSMAATKLTGTVDPARLTGTYAISITGNAATVTNGVVTTGSYADPAWITSLAETKLTLTDVTTNNASTVRHGLLPKLGGGTTNFLRADGTWATPVGTTYSEITTAEIDAGTATTTRTITGRRVGYILNTKVAAQITTAIAGKQDTLVSGTNIKTVGGQSLLGSGNIDVSGAAVLSYTDRGNIRSVDGPAALLYIIESLGLFVWISGSTEVDDDETCFATASGRWLLYVAAWDFIDETIGTELDVIRQSVNVVSVFLQPAAISANSSLSFAVSCGASIGDAVLVIPPADASPNIVAHAHASGYGQAMITLKNPDNSLSAGTLTGIYQIVTLKGLL